MGSLAVALIVVLASAPQCASATPKRDPRTEPLTQDDAVRRIERVAGQARLVADVDGDGVSDLAVPRGKSGGSLESIDFVSAKSGATIREAWRAADGALVSAWDAQGDANGDGRPDIVIGLAEHDGRRGRVIVVDGASGTELSSVAGAAANDAFGANVAWIGDVDRDGHADFVASATQFDPTVWPADERSAARTWHRGATRQRADWQARLAKRSSAPGFVSARSGATGAELWRLAGTVNGHAFGQHLRVVPDLDADGCRDVLVWSDTRSDQPACIVSGETGATFDRIQSRFCPAGCAGDLDRDGTPDLYVQEQGRTLPGVVAIEFWSGKTRQSLFALPPPDAWSYETVVGALGDVDGDGVTDFAFGDATFTLPGPDDPGGKPGPALDVRTLSLKEARTYGSIPWCGVAGETGCVLVYSGRSRELLMGIWARPGERIELGRDITALPDVTGDGIADFLVGVYAQALVFAGPGPAAK